MAWRVSSLLVGFDRTARTGWPVCPLPVNGTPRTPQAFTHRPTAARTLAFAQGRTLAAAVPRTAFTR